MKTKTTNFDFIKVCKKWLLGYVAIILVGLVVFAIFGADLSIDFKGGTYFNYSFTGDINLKDAEKVIEEVVKTDINVTESKGYNTDDKNLIIIIEEGESLSVKTQSDLLAKLTKTYPNSNIKLGESNAVGSTIASNFFIKCLVSVLLAGILVILYVGIRFRKIGGVSAGMFALLALFLDCIMAFLACVFFRLEIDNNFMAVILTTLGYSLNDTIVIYDRIRENSKLYPDMAFHDRINLSINQTLGRTIKTAFATFLAIITIVVVAEFFGLSSLRSFAIPMAVGIISGCISTVCLSGPLWYNWRIYSDARKAKKEKKAIVK